VTGLKPVQIANSPVVLNTPHLTESGESDKGVMPGSMWRRVLALEAEAQAYLNGKTAPKEQRDIFEDAHEHEDDILTGTTVSINGGPEHPATDLKKPGSPGARAVEQAVLGGRDRAAGRDE
jgi:hypothetical protein